MNPFNKIWHGLRSLRQAKTVKQEIDEELRFHIENRAAENLAAGMSPEEAAREARRRFGNLQSVREECRESRGASFGEATAQDVRFAHRQLLKNPGFTTVAVLTLALGIGANTAMFSLVNALLFKPIHAQQPGHLAGVYQQEKADSGNFRFFSYPNYADLRASKETFEDLLAFWPGNVAMREGDLTRPVAATFVSANYFSVLGVAPLHGRGFLPEEETSTMPVAVISYPLWQRLGADPAMIGKTLVLNNTTFTLVGIMPRGFTGTGSLTSPGLFLPLGMMDPLAVRPGGVVANTLADRSAENLSLVGRFSPGVSLANSTAPLQVLSERLAAAYPKENRGYQLVAAPIARLGFSNSPERGLGDTLFTAALTLAMSAMLLLIACLNLANMLLARGSARRKEFAVRMAVGASRRRVLRQLLTEGFLLALLSGAAGVLLAVWATHALAVFAGPGFSQKEFLTFNSTPDVRVLAVSLGFCALATIFFALGPAWRLARLNVNADLKMQGAEDARSKPAGLFAMRHLLVIGQVALSLALLVAGGMFVRSVGRAVQANPGFAFGSNFYAELQAGAAGYDEPRVRELYRGATEQIAALPGVESDSLAWSMPFGDADYAAGVQRAGSSPLVDGKPFATVAEGKDMVANNNVIGTDYFRTLGVPLLRGREFTRTEVESTNAPRVAIVSQSLADELWPGEDALGRRLQFTRARADAPDTSMEVIGVVPELKQDLMGKASHPFLYQPYGQAYQPSMLLQVRVSPGADSKSLMRQAGEALRRLDPLLPVAALKTLRASHENSVTVALLRMGARIFGTFGLVALFLAVIGIYGVRAYSVARRTREIGIRMALGASSRDVLRLILREGLLLTAMGLGLGLMLAVAIGKLANGFLYDIAVIDPFAFTMAPALLALSALLACWLPARRASKVDPIVALRSE